MVVVVVDDITKCRNGEIVVLSSGKTTTFVCLETAIEPSRIWVEMKVGVTLNCFLVVGGFDSPEKRSSRRRQKLRETGLKSVRARVNGSRPGQLSTSFSTRGVLSTHPFLFLTHPY